MGRMFGLGNLTKLFDVSSVKDSATVMAGGALSGVGYAVLVSKVGWFDSPIKRGGLAFVLGVVGPKLARKANNALVKRMGDGVQGAMGAVIGMELWKALNSPKVASATNTGPSDGLADVDVMEGDELMGLSDAAVEERRLSAGGSFADASYGDPRGMLAGIIGA